MTPSHDQTLVSEAARALDKRAAGWHRWVDTKSLDIGDENNDLVRQLSLPIEDSWFKAEFRNPEHQDLWLAEIAQRRRDDVRRAALVVGKLWPDWYSRIDIPTLDLEDPSCCILCQLSGSYSRALDEHPILDGVHNTLLNNYDIPAWVEEINLRLGNGAGEASHG